MKILQLWYIFYVCFSKISNNLQHQCCRNKLKWKIFINYKNERLSHTWYLSRTHGRCPWRKNLSCGEISNFCTWNMWRKLKFLHKWINFKFLHMTDVEKSEISFVVCTIYGILLHFTLFCCNFLAFYAVLSQNRSLRLTRYCVETNLAKNSTRGEKWQIWGMIWFSSCLNPFHIFMKKAFELMRSLADLTGALWSSKTLFLVDKNSVRPDTLWGQPHTSHRVIVFIGPRYTWGQIYGSESL